MARAKRPRRPPDVSRGPRPVQASKLPDRRPPKRGKSGSPLATGNAKAKSGPPPRPGSVREHNEALLRGRGAPTGTSVSGKSTGPATVERIASTETPRKPVAEKPTKPRRLNERELRERDKRFREAFGKKRRLEKEKKRVTADLSAEIKELAQECDQLHDELESGYEQLKQGELDLQPPEENAGAATPTAAQTDQALGEIAKRVGENGNGADGQEPRPPIDTTKADAVRMAAATSGAADDITRAAEADRATHP